ncbi:MAG: hypothetical protein AB1898_03890 [Acidobacteriota bacterium]
MTRTETQGTALVDRRRLLRALLLVTPFGTATGQGRSVSIEAIRHAATVHGMELSDERLEAIKKPLEHRLSNLQTIRRFDLDETVEPATVFLPLRPPQRP